MRVEPRWPVSLEGCRVAVRSLTEADLPATLRWRNHAESRRWFKTSAIIEEAAHLDWYRKYAASGTEYMFFFETRDERTPVGQGGIYSVDHGVATAEVGRFVSDPDFRGKGLFREGLMTMLDYAHAELRLQAVRLEVIKTNARAIRLYDSVGFMQCGEDGKMLSMRMEFNRHAGALRSEREDRNAG